jgi:hypothetical protein
LAAKADLRVISGIEKTLVLFHFELFPMEKIEPWTDSGGEEKSLHWYALTLGCYWIDTGVGELFRYSPEIMTYWAQTYPEAWVYPYVNYQVSRLWEDLLDILPTVLESVPIDSADYLPPGGKWNSWSDWEHWSDHAFEWADSHEDEAGWDAMLGWDISGKATHWWSSRGLDSGYLTKPPRINFWREGDQICIRWDNRNQKREGIPVWASASGYMTLPIEAFIAEVQSFNDRLITQMAERVDAIQHHWSRPDISIDLKGLVKAQQYRATLLSDILAQPAQQTDWEPVRAALAEMERYLAETTPQESTG